MKKLDVNDYGFAHLTLILLLHYLMKCRSHILAVYNSEFILGSACVGSENHCETTKALKICYLFNINCMHFKIAIVTVSRWFTADDKQLTKSLRQLKGYSSRRFFKEFPQKKLDAQRT